MTIEEKVKEYVETKGKEHFIKFYNEERSIADLLKKCCLEFTYEMIKEYQDKENKLLDIISNYEVKVADLEKQIEKMKCCGNCNNETYGLTFDALKKSEICKECKNKSKWEIKE